MNSNDGKTLSRCYCLPWGLNKHSYTSTTNSLESPTQTEYFLSNNHGLKAYTRIPILLSVHLQPRKHMINPIDSVCHLRWHRVNYIGFVTAYCSQFPKKINYRVLYIWLHKLCHCSAFDVISIRNPVLFFDYNHDTIRFLLWLQLSRLVCLSSIERCNSNIQWNISKKLWQHSFFELEKSGIYTNDTKKYHETGS